MPLIELPVEDNRGGGGGVRILLLSEVTSFENKRGVYEYEISSVLNSARA